MIQAALRGKIPSKLEESEDILTSNVFSFFKYASRGVYLAGFLRGLGISAKPAEIEGAEFRFWPRYDDHTEPDLVLLVGDYYLLFEAKHLSSFGEATPERKGQIHRELEGGENEATSLGKNFRYIAITSHYNKPIQLFQDVPADRHQVLTWTNWQFVAKFLLEILERETSPPDISFATDLYNLLDKKKLRSFLSFDRLVSSVAPPQQTLFFSAKTARFRGAFIGFTSALENSIHLSPVPRRLFYQRYFFHKLPNYTVHSSFKSIFRG